MYRRKSTIALAHRMADNGQYFCTKPSQIGTYRPFANETDLVEFAKTHLPILLGTHVTVFRSQLPRPVHRIH